MPASSRSCSRAKARSTPGCSADLALCFDEVQHWLDFWHTIYDQPRGDNRTDIAFPHASEIDDASRKKLDARLHDMDVGSEAVFVAGMAMHALLRSLGVEPDVMMGHSSGESAALAASGALPAETPLELAAFVRELNAVYERVLAEGKIATGALLAVGALPAEAVQEQIAATGPGRRRRDGQLCQPARALRSAGDAIATLQSVLTGAGAICLPLPFDRGYHTPDFADVSAAFLAYYGRIKLRAPRVPLYSCASAGLLSGNGGRRPQARRGAVVAEGALSRDDRADGRRRRRLLRRGRSVGQPHGIRQRHSRPARRRSRSRATCAARNGVEQLLTVLAQLYASGRPVRVQSLFDGRRIAAVDLGEARRLASLRRAARQHHADDSLLETPTVRPCGRLAAACERRAAGRRGLDGERRSRRASPRLRRTSSTDPRLEPRSARRRHGRVFRRHARLSGAAAGGRRVVASLAGRNGRA